MRVPIVATLVSVLGCVHHVAPATDPIDTAVLRARGQAGLDSVLARLEVTTDQAERERLIIAITKVAGQKDAHISHLYWFEDLDAALAEAKKSGKPVLSLRMLGRLDEELSCANSRFFRTTLYANEEVSTFLRKNFVLHWSSERPVPVATIDFGDGRKVTRTVTGNSIHYVLDAKGFVVDALPGLYGAKTFIEVLSRSKDVAKWSPERRARWHETQMDALTDRFRIDQEAAGISPVAVLLPTLPGVDSTTPWPSAIDAVPMAMPKAMVEMPVVRAFVPGGAMRFDFDPTQWERLAQVRAKEAKLDARAKALVLSKNPVDVTDVRVPKLNADQRVLLVTKLEESIASDTARNEFALHAVIHKWLSERPQVTREDLNREVYARLFLTPASDPWLGLVPALTYTALPNDGLLAEGKK